MSVPPSESPNEIPLPQAEIVESSPSEGVAELATPQGVATLGLEEQLSSLGSVDEKIRFALGAMKSALVQEAPIRFNEIWGWRAICIELFKEGVHPAIRAELWGEYQELNGQARSLKERVDGASELAAARIELAIESIECGLSEAPPSTQYAGAQLDGPVAYLFEKYRAHQGELTHLNRWAEKVNALRKELIAQEMRLGRKTRLFRRLSLVGDRIFPRRKELIKEVGGLFLAEVDSFIELSFSNEQPERPLYLLREEIKAFQSLAKLLTLSSHTFIEARGRLSRSWEMVREKERERKARQGQRLEQQASSKEASRAQKSLAKPIATETTMRAVESLFEREKRLLALQGKGREDLRALEEYLMELRERRAEARVQIEELRGLAKSSGLTLDAALSLEERQGKERDRLSQLESSIYRLEARLASLGEPSKRG